MTPRRALLIAGAAGIVFTAPSLVTAADVEAEGSVYQGATTGEWVCGPVGRARYAGTAAMLRVSERRARSKTGTGWNLRLAGAAEAERITILSENDGCDLDCGLAPPERVLYGGSVRLGSQEGSFSLEAGLSMHEAWENRSSRSPEVTFVPEFELGFGKPTGGRGFFGIGTPLVTTQRRPALIYGGGIGRIDERFELFLAGGVYRAGPAAMQELVLRLDAQLRMQLARDWELRAGNAFNEYPFNVDGFESMLSVVTRF